MVAFFQKREYITRRSALGQIRYTKTHEWLELGGDTGTVGVTDRLSLEFGKIVYIEMPEVGDEFEQDEVMGTIEFVTGDTLDFHAPLSGEVIAVNRELEDDPYLLNTSAEGDGWICRLLLENPREMELLMSRTDYEVCDEEEEIEPDADYEDGDVDYDL